MSEELNLVLSADAISLQSRGDASQVYGHIAVSQAALTALYFEGESINPSRLEQAIEWTEDRIQAAKAAIPPGAALFTNEEDLRELARVSGVPESADMLLHVDAVEATFSRLVMQAFGQAPRQESLPTSARFFATVVFTRELMHHLNFPQIHVLPRADAAPV